MLTANDPWVYATLGLLSALGYRADDRVRIVRYALDFGHVEFCPLFRDEGHRDAVSQLLPESEEWADGAWDAEVWNADAAGTGEVARG